MENTSTVAENKVYAYDTEYARGRKTCVHYWTLDLIKALSLLAVIGVAYLLSRVISPEDSMYIPFVIGLLVLAFVIYRVFKAALHTRTDAWFCSFARKDGRLYHLEFSPKQGFGIFGTLFDGLRCEASIKAAANPDIVNLAVSCKEAGVPMPANSDFHKVEVTPLPDARIIVDGKKVTITYTDGKGKVSRLATADCFNGLTENAQ